MTQTTPPVTDYRQHLEVETPEHVMLDLEVAGIGSRVLAAVIDNAILGGATLGFFLLLGILAGFGLVLGRWGIALLVLGGFAAWTGYFILFEGLRRGQTPGKRMVGIRVVMETGKSVSLGSAAARNLLRIADFLPPPYLLGILLIAFHPRGKRLGDMVAGTIVARDRPSSPPPQRQGEPSPELASIPELSDAEFRLLAQFESRHQQLPPQGRARLAVRLMERLGDLVAPAGVSDTDHLLGLYHEERARREGRLAGRGAGGTGTRWVARKRERWEEFQRLAERAARGGLDRFASHELPDFAARYREVAADLARARTYRADDATLAHLERLVAAGHNALYRDERSTWRSLWQVLARECPAAVLRARGYVLVGFLAFLAPAAAGFGLMRERPELASELLPKVMLDRAEAGAARQAEGRKYFDVAAEYRPLIASGIITNNVRVAIACFAGGIFIGIGSLILLGFNGLSIGATAGHFANVGLFG